MTLLKASDARFISDLAGGVLGNGNLVEPIKRVLGAVEQAAGRGDVATTVDFQGERADLDAAINALAALGYQAQRGSGPGVPLEITW